MLPLRLSLLAVGGLLAGCTTQLAHTPLTTAGPTEPGFPYYLPKQVYAIEVTYELMECPGDLTVPSKTGTLRVLYSGKELRVRQMATVVESNLADRNEHYLLTYQSLDSPLKTTKFSASVYANQTLKSVGAEITDGTVDVIKNLGSTAASIARMAAGFPMPAAAIPLRCNARIYQRLADLADLQRKLLDPRLNGDERAAALDAVDRLRQGLTQRARASLEPSWTNLTAPVGLTPAQVSAWLISGSGTSVTVATQSVVKIELSGAHPASDDTLAAARSGRGVVYREPVPADVRVYAGTVGLDGASIGSVPASIAQLGRKLTLLLDNGVFDKNNLTLNFAANGALESMEYGTEASLVKATGALAGIATQVEDFRAKKKEADKARRDAEAGAELKGIQAETELLTAKADRIEARKRLNGLEATDSE